MKNNVKHALVVFLFLLMACVRVTGYSQTQSNVVRLDAGARVTNTIFWQNVNQMPTSAGVSVSYSALDSVTPGAMNIQLLTNPFVNGYRINSSSPAFNSGTSFPLRSTDTLDLDYQDRFGHPKCPEVDMGAYEYQVIATEISVQPADTSTCIDVPVTLSVVADGTNVTFQWQKNGANIFGANASTLTLSGNISDAGSYRVIAYGDCCNDTSISVNVTVDPKPVLAEMRNDTTINSGQSVQLMNMLTTYTGTAKWFESDFRTEVSPTLVTNITQTKTYIVEITNGACSDKLTGTAMILINGAECILKTRSDTLICYGNPILLAMDTAWVDYDWTIAGTNQTLPKYSWYTPDSTVQLVAKSKNGDCGDTLTVTVYKIPFWIMDDFSVCGEFGGTEVQLLSEPPADAWFRLREGAEEYIGPELPRVTIESNTFNTFIAKYSDGFCEITAQVLVLSEPPKFSIFAPDTAICESEPVRLTTDAHPFYTVQWKVKGSSEWLPVNPTVNPRSTTVYQAWILHSVCEDVFEEITISVQPKPSFKIANDSKVCTMDSPYTFHLSSTPNASFWTLLNGTRTFNPVAVNDRETYVGWYREGVCLVSDTLNVILTCDTFDVRVHPYTLCYNEGWAWAEIVNGATGPYTFRWSNGTTKDTVWDLSAGDYSVTVTDKFGLPVTRPFKIDAGIPILISYTKDEPNNQTCDNGRIIATATGGLAPYYFVWYNDLWDDEIEGFDKDTLTNLDDLGAYSLFVIDSRGCLSRDTAEIDLSCTYINRILPNKFITPNGDGKNDYLKIKNIEHYPKNRVLIFNAYGENVWEQKNYDNTGVKWDGKNKNGKVLPDGVYYYIVEADGYERMAGWILMKGSKHK
jgi:gliding motility-associated-like protein